MSKTPVRTKDQEEHNVEYNEEQYAILLRCSEKNDISEWNQYRKDNPYKEINLKGVNLREANLEFVDLTHADLSHADLTEAKLSGVDFSGANLSEARLLGANISLANISLANLSKADLSGVNLFGSDLSGVNLSETNLSETNLNYAEFLDVFFWGVNLRGAEFGFNNLKGMQFYSTKVDSSTSFYNCIFDDQTDFSSINLDVVQFDPGIKDQIKGVQRRQQWQSWGKQKSYSKPHLLVDSGIDSEENSEKVGRVKHFLVNLFWEMSDYGMSTIRLVGIFVLSSLIFTCIYFACGILGSPVSKAENLGIIQNLFNENPIAEGYSACLLRSLYFSVVTMTTLGFGDISANPASYWGHGLLILQVIFGYVFLGAIITRLGILFTSEGPADPKKFIITREKKFEKYAIIIIWINCFICLATIYFAPDLNTLVIPKPATPEPTFVEKLMNLF